MITFKEFVGTTIPLPVQTPVPLSVTSNTGLSSQAQQAGEQAAQQQTSVNLAQFVGNSRDVFNRLRTGLETPVEVKAMSISPSKHIIQIAVQGPNLKWSAAKAQIAQQIPKLNITY